MSRFAILDHPWMVRYLFDRFKWYRSWRGGHWECWWNDVTHSYMWDRFSECYKARGGSDYPPCCFGTPICEDYDCVAESETK